MRIAIIGAGDVGGGLATALAAVGHEVVFGVRDPGSEECRAVVAAAAGTTAASPARAVAGAVVVVFALRRPAVRGIVAEDAGPRAYAKVLEGKVRVWLALAQRHGRTVGYALSLG